PAMARLLPGHLMVAASVAAAVPTPASARGGGGHGRHSHEHRGKPRSEAARREFMEQTGFPHGRHGYVIDHIVPLACGGADAPSNMQWQTIEEAKAKDRVERQGCRGHAPAPRGRSL